MALSLKTKKELTKELAKRYQKASKKEKSQILDEFTKTTGYNRSYASYLLSHHGKIIYYAPLKAFQIDAKSKIKRKRKPIYDEKVKKALIYLWKISYFPCGKRLKSLLPKIIPKLIHFNEIVLDKEIEEKLLKISPATIDRLLSSTKKAHRLRNRSKTKPGTLLKKQIPVRVFNEWDENRPGFMEIDLVAHTQDSARGEFLYTLCATDIFSGWIELFALKNRAQKWTFSAILQMKERLPFPLLGIDSDNGSEFINAHLLRFCKENKITFTRSRPYRKNDNCYVEQKNYSVVRKFVGYLKHDTEEELEILNEFYQVLRLYINFFQPSAKLIFRERVGGKIRKRYDSPKSPYERLMESPYISEETKEELKALYEKLNPAELYRRIRWYQRRLERAYFKKKGIIPRIKMKVGKGAVK